MKIEERLKKIEKLLQANGLHEESCPIFLFRMAVPPCTCWFKEDE